MWLCTLSFLIFFSFFFMKNSCKRRLIWISVDSCACMNCAEVGLVTGVQAFDLVGIIVDDPSNPTHMYGLD